MKPIRIAKALSNYGVCSRRQAEVLILENRVKVNDQILTSPIYLVQNSDQIYVDGVIVSKPIRTRLWKYFKPKGVITSHKDNFGRTTLFEELETYLATKCNLKSSESKLSSKEMKI